MEELDLKEIFSIFWNKKIQIAIITIIFIIIGTVYSYVFLEPKYESYTKVVLAKTEGGASSTGVVSDSITQSDLTINKSIISTYSELVTTKSVLRPVISKLAIEGLDEESLKKSLTVELDDTQMMKIIVRNSNPKNAADIANEITDVFKEQVTDIYKLGNVHVVDKAEVPDGPYNVNHVKDIIVFAIAGLVVASLYVLILNMFDTTVKEAETFEKSTGILVLAQIPEYDFEVRMRGKKK